MKILRLIAIVLVLSCPIIFAEEMAPNPVGFIPAAFKSADDPLWVQSFSAELFGLLSETTLTSQTLRLGANFCRKAEFPADPVSAARQVYLMLLQTDYMVRSGIPIAQVKISTLIAWSTILTEYEGEITVKDVKEALKDLLKDLKDAEKDVKELEKELDKLDKLDLKDKKEKEEKIK